MKASEGRKFAFTLALGFGGLAGIALWRDKPHSGLVVGGIGLVAFLAGLLVPTRLGFASRAWQALGERLSRVTSPIVYAILYYVVFTPVGVLRRTLGRSPLARSPDAHTYWVPRSPQPVDEARRGMEHLF